MFRSVIRFSVVSSLGAAALVAAAAGPAAAAGCMTPGYGGTVLQSECSFTETDAGANVWVLAQANWRVTAERSCPIFTNQCQAGAAGCTEPCTPALESDNCTPAAANQCRPAGTTYVRSIRLAEGTTLPTEQPIHAATRPGDLVRVLMVADDAGQGPWGFISVGQDDDLLRSVGVDDPR